jgi:hypothetical protein
MVPPRGQYGPCRHADNGCPGQEQEGYSDKKLLKLNNLPSLIIVSRGNIEVWAGQGGWLYQGWFAAGLSSSFFLLF